MPFDALTLAAVCQELQDKVVGGRVQKVVAPGPLSVSLELYRAGTGRAHLLLSAHPQHARVHLTSAAPSRDPEQHPPFLLLLRKYVKGGTLTNVSQPRFERVITLSIAKRLPPGKHQEYHFEGDFRDSEEDEEEDPTLPVTTVELIAEIMGRVSNIVLVEEDGTVMDSIKRIPSSINRYRVTLPHHPYVPPPPQEKRDPTHTSLNALSLEIERPTQQEAGAPAWKGLVNGYAAVSPTLAREVVFRALGSSNVPAPEVAGSPALLSRLMQEMQSIFELEQSGHWQPTVAYRPESEGIKSVLDFAPYPLLHLQAQGAELELCESMSQTADRYFERAQRLEGHGALKAQTAAALAELRSRDERKLRSLEEEWQRAQQLETLRRKGELLLAYMHTLQPGQRSLTIPEEELTIDIPSVLTPVEYSQAIFKEYRKARSAVEGLPERMEEARVRLSFFDDLANSLDLATSYDEIKAVSMEISAGGRPPSPHEETAGKKARAKARGNAARLPQPLRLQTHSGAQLLVGRTAGQNDTATFRLAGPDDLWFHARAVPGSHVILRASPELTEEDVEEAARLAAGYSKLREDAQVDVIYTEKRYVRKIANAPPGQATYRNERTIRVAPLRKQQNTRKG